MSLPLASFILIFIVPLVTAHFVRFGLRRQKCLTNDELIEQYPQYAWVKFEYPLLGIFTVGSIFIFGALIASKDQTGGRLWILIAGFSLSSMNFLESILALTTGLYSASTRSRFYYVYDSDKKLTWLAKLQLCMAMMTVIGSVFAYIFWPS